jgi:negative regulator of sigma E activity
MNEVERSSQVSALFDGELDPTQSDLVTRRLLRDPALRASWGRYAVLGASLRGEPLTLTRPAHADVASRVRARLELEAELAAPEALPSAAPRRTGGRTLAFGSALAAGVAAMAIVVLRLHTPVAPAVPSIAAAAPVALPATGQAAAGRAQLASRDTPAPSYTTPTDDRPASARLAAPLVNYVVAHSEYTTPVARFSPLSAVMTSNLDPSVNTVEMTEAEVGARR